MVLNNIQQIQSNSNLKKGDVIVSVKNLIVQFSVRNKILTAIRNISLDIYKGETIAIVGERGSGKSVFTKCLTGMLEENGKIAGGQILYSGVDLAQFKTNEEWQQIRGKRISTIFQDPMTSLDPIMKAGEQIAEMLRAKKNLNRREAREKVIEMFEKIGITPAEKRYEQYPFEMSGGMLQRIMIAMALICEPKLLIADEPTTAIDAITQYEILNELLHIKANHNTAMIFISHDLNAISRVADRIVVLNHGAVVDRGDFQHILHHAQDPYTKLLVEKRADVMRRYTAVLNGKKETAHA